MSLGCRSAKIFFVLLTIAAGASAARGADFKYIRAGNPDDAPAARTRAGFALMGGGDDLDEAFQFLCDRAGGGDFLILRATGDDEYNPYLQKLCHLNSVATLILPTRAAASAPEVAKIIHRASAIFISGGDQANYINFWMGTPVQSELNDATRRGVPIGGTSAGLAVMGEYGYSAQGDKPDDPDLDSKTALADPFHPRVTLEHGFLDIPILKGLITDTHFARRNRMGRLLVFLARLNEPDCKALPASAPRVRGVGVEEKAAVLVDPDGQAHVVGSGSAYFIDASGAHGPLCEIKPLTFGPYKVAKVAPSHTFNLKNWQGEAITYTLSIQRGTVISTQPGGAIY
jgi:cyanophycinase